MNKDQNIFTYSKQSNPIKVSKYKPMQTLPIILLTVFRLLLPNVPHCQVISREQQHVFSVCLFGIWDFLLVIHYIGFTTATFLLPFLKPVNHCEGSDSHQNPQQDIILLKAFKHGLKPAAALTDPLSWDNYNILTTVHVSHLESALKKWEDDAKLKAHMNRPILEQRRQI